MPNEDLLFEDDIIIIHMWIMMLGIGVLELQRRKRNGNRRWGVRPINRRRDECGSYLHLFQEMKYGDPDQFFKFTRMTVPQFNYLLSKVKPFLLKRSRRRPIGPEQRLAITLKFLSQGGTMQSLAWEFRIGRSTASVIIRETCNVIWNVLSPIYLEEPNQMKWKEIAQGFWGRWNLPNCLGAIDGKHVVIQCPIAGGSQYYSYKSTHSIILMAVCDSNYKFTLVDIGGYGSQGDRSIFANSQFGQDILNNRIDAPKAVDLPGSNVEMPHFFVGDEAFPLKQNLLRPYPGKFLNQNKRIFNYRLSRARRTIENAFGILASRWRIFRGSIIAEPPTVDAIIKATVCLHNYLKTNENENPGNPKTYCPDSYADQYDANGEVILGQWRSETSDSCSLRDLGRAGANRTDFNSINVRDNLAAYLVSNAGEVEWQYDYVNRGRAFQL